jgi:hypothetical protein
VSAPYEITVQMAGQKTDYDFGHNHPPLCPGDLHAHGFEENPETGRLERDRPSARSWRVRPEMEADKQFWCAWIKDISALAVWDLIVEQISMPVWAIVTMLDSNEQVADLAAIKQLLTANQGQVVSLGHAVLFDSDAFAKLRIHGDSSLPATTRSG